MSLYALHLANGRTSNTGVLRLMGRLLSGSGVIESTAFTVAAQLTPDMTIKVSGSTAADNLVIITTGGDTYHGWNTASANVTITSNATGVTKKDHIVAYIDTALTTVTPDNPTGLVLIAVRGSSTLAPTDGEINTATGSKPWIRLAEISISNGASSINSGNITDLRVVSTFSVASSPVTKLGFASVTANQNSLGAGPVDLTSLTTTVTAPANRGIKITAYAPFTCGTADNNIILEIKEGGTVLNQSSAHAAIASRALGVFCIWYITTPSGGSHTYKLAVETSGGTVNMIASATQAAFILAEAV